MSSGKGARASANAPVQSAQSGYGSTKRRKSQRPPNEATLRAFEVGSGPLGPSLRRKESTSTAGSRLSVIPAAHGEWDADYGL